jgi:hypothetical protein
MGVWENQRENEKFHKETRNSAGSGLFTSQDKKTGSSSGPTIYWAPDLPDWQILLVGADNQATHSPLPVICQRPCHCVWSDANNGHTCEVFSERFIGSYRWVERCLMFDSSRRWESQLA